LPYIRAFLGQSTALLCPIYPVVGIKQLYWSTPHGDRISADSITNAGYSVAELLRKIYLHMIANVSRDVKFYTPHNMLIAINML